MQKSVLITCEQVKNMQTMLDKTEWCRLVLCQVKDGPEQAGKWGEPERCRATWGNKSNENKGRNLSPTQHNVVEVGPKQWRSSAETQWKLENSLIVRQGRAKEVAGKRKCSSHTTRGRGGESEMPITVGKSLRARVRKVKGRGRWGSGEGETSSTRCLCTLLHLQRSQLN